MANIVVTNLNDSGTGSLREAIATANATPEADTIIFAASLSGGTLRLTNNELNITSDLTIDGDIDGDNRADIVITGDASGDDITSTDSFGNTITDATVNSNFADNSRVFDVHGSGADVRLEHLVITGGSSGSGSGITVSNGSTLSVYQSTIAGNRASLVGAGTLNSNSTLEIADSTILGNIAGSLGGGVYSFTDFGSSQATTITNTTIVDNIAADGGGIINRSGNLTVQNSTITGNTASMAGGGIVSRGDGTAVQTTISSTIVAGNTATVAGADDVALFDGLVNSFASSSGSNLIGDGNALFTNGAAGNIVGNTAAPIDPMLGSLGDNGGPVGTILLQAASVAVDTGSNPASLATDARGQPRSFEFITGGGKTDIGATELQQVILTVTNLNDAGAGSLREAITTANGTVGSESIIFAPGLSGGILRLTSGPLSITSGLTIDGDINGDNIADIVITGDANGDDATTVDSFGNTITNALTNALTNTNTSDNVAQVFDITGPFGTSATLSSLVVTGGYGATAGGGIELSGQMNLTLENSTVAGNRADFGGGIRSDGATLSVLGSTIVGNVANFDGGGISLYSSFDLTSIVNTTITDNHALGGEGGGIYNDKNVLDLFNSTVTGNTSTGPGGGVHNSASGSSTTLRSTIVAGNSAGTLADADVVGPISSFNFSFSNLIGNGSSIFTNGVGGNIVGSTGALIDPLLSPLANNGGPVATMLLQAGSPALDAGSNPANQTTDARGEMRDVDLAAGPGTVDIGATELQQLSAPVTAQAFEVTTLNDELDFIGSDATITTMGGLADLSLREALFLANQNGATADTITFAVGLSGGTLRLTQGELTISGDVSITGDVNGDNQADIVITGDTGGDDATTIDSFGNTITVAITNTNTSDNTRVLRVIGSETEATLSSLVVTGGVGSAYGGGGIQLFTGGALTVQYATIAGNYAPSTGGGILNFGGTLSVIDTTVSGNRAPLGGGIISFGNLADGQLTTISNTTISGNEATSSGGGVFNNGGRTIVQNSTISGNTASTSGGGITSLGDGTALTNVESTIIAGNTAAIVGNTDVALHDGVTNSFSGSPGNNLIGDGNVLFVNGVSGNIVGSPGALVDPMLGLLANNGGPVETLLLKTASLAIDAGSNTAALTDDARGGNRVVGGTADIGAVEIAVATAGANILFGTPDIDSIDGLGGNDTIFGLASNDTIIGGTGADTMHGDAGDDTFLVDNAGDIVIEEAGEGTNDRVAASVSYELSANADIELLTTTSSGGAGSINLTGNRLAQTIIGNAGINILADGAGAGDVLNGLGGNDVYIVRSKFTTINESAGQGTNDRVATSFDFTLAADDDIELLTTTSAAATSGIDLTGNAKAQTIVGNAGNNILRSSTGAADTMMGLGGNDIYRVFNTGDQITEATDRGTDRVITKVDYALGAGDSIELFTTNSTESSTAINLTGNRQTQTIVGNSGDNVISDGGGAGDILAGFKGNDTYIVRSKFTTINETPENGVFDRVAASFDFALAVDDEIEILTTTSAAGTSNIDLTGNSRAQTIIGNAGNNILRTGNGFADTMIGLGGNDVYRVSNRNDRIIETAGNGTDRVIAKTEYKLGANDSIELFSTDNSTATTSIFLTGNRFAQTITGNAGGNVLADGGGTGADVLRGLGGNDIYIVRSKNTIVVENVGQGTSDRVSASFDFALAADDHIERLTTTSRAGTAAIDLAGNAFAQIITGNAGNNVLRSGTGAADTLQGLGGDDIYRVFNKGDRIDESANQGTDRVITTIDYVLGSEDSIELFTTSNSTGTSNIDLTGNELAQTIIGNAGDNRIEGKDGSDTLSGLAGSDAFIFKNRITSTNIDTITDFDVTADQIDIDNDPFVFSALRWESNGTLRGRFFKANKEGVATDGSDTIIYDTDSGELYYDPDGAGSGLRQHFAILSSGLDLTSSNFEVI